MEVRLTHRGITNGVTEGYNISISSSSSSNTTSRSSKRLSTVDTTATNLKLSVNLRVFGDSLIPLRGSPHFGIVSVYICVMCAHKSHRCRRRCRSHRLYVLSIVCIEVLKWRAIAATSGQDFSTTHIYLYSIYIFIQYAIYKSGWEDGSKRNGVDKESQHFGI